jgi:hypothetical protein
VTILKAFVNDHAKTSLSLFGHKIDVEGAKALAQVPLYTAITSLDGSRVHGEILDQICNDALALAKLLNDVSVGKRADAIARSFRAFGKESVNSVRCSDGLAFVAKKLSGQCDEYMGMVAVVERKDASGELELQPLSELVSTLIDVHGKVSALHREAQSNVSLLAKAGEEAASGKPSMHPVDSESRAPNRRHIDTSNGA